MLEVILDTETTGLSTSQNHRIVEIGCIELENQSRQITFSMNILILKEKYLKKHTKFMDTQKNFFLIKRLFLK